MPDKMYFLIKSSFGSKIVCSPKVVAKNFALLKKAKALMPEEKIVFSISKNPDKNDKKAWEEIKLNEIC